jgi:triacylglycerol esterase/lipase EstA (alpha/beta hydrolase family)
MFTISASRLSPALAVLLAILALAAPSAGARSARTTPPGPPLTEPRSALRDALECSDGVQHAKRDPVLLVHGTGSTAEESWGWGYRKVLPQQDFPACTVTLPDRSMEDIQRATEYVVYAIRRMAELSGRQVAVVGHSQGAVELLWALRFWPDLPPLVSDYVALAGPINGGALGHILCADSRGCVPAFWQLTPGSRFLRALHAAPPPRGPAYTSIATRLDEFVFPQPAASRLEGARNIVIQDVCPARAVEHLAMLGDFVTYALVVDALTHPGPTDPARVPGSVCLEGGMLPDQRGAAGLANVLASDATWRRVAEEPPLRCYADPGCPGRVAHRNRARPRLRIAVAPRRIVAGRRARFRFRVTADGRRVAKARLRFAGRGARTNLRGRAVLVVRLRRPGRHPVLVQSRGLRSGRAFVRAIRRGTL